MAEWGSLFAMLQQATKQRLQGLDQMQEYAKSNPMPREHLGALLDVSGQLLGDNNYKVALRALQVWEAVVQNEGDGVKPFVNNLLPYVVERLSDNKQEVRQAACNLMLEVLQSQVLRPETMNDRLARFWGHKHWKVRHGLLQFVAEAVCMLGDAALASRDSSDPRVVVGQVIRLVEDPESAVRDAAIECLEEIYGVLGEPLVDIVSRAGLRPAQLREIYARLGQAARAAEVPASSASGLAAGGLVDAAAARDTASSRAEREPDQHTPPRAAPAAAKLPKAARVAPGAGSPGGAAAADAGRPPAGPQQRPRSAAPAAAAAPSRRGGYKDGGGVGVAGELPEATPLAVASERELHSEMDKIAAALACGATADWQRRIAAMLRLEGLVKGGAAAFDDAFDEALRPLREPMGEQLLDRRSAVSRQACHVLGALSAALGPRFDAFAAAMVPHLFKVLVITVQVVADAADTCARDLVRNHHSPKIAAAVCDALAGDKNAKLRQSCSVFLLEILEGWHPHDYSHHEDKVEAALTRAVGDNLTTTRAAGRAAFCAYRLASPDRAAALLRRLDGPTQQKLLAASRDYVPGALASGGSSGASAPPSRPSSAGSTHSVARGGGGGGGQQVDAEALAAAAGRAPALPAARVAVQQPGAARTAPAPAAAADVRAPHAPLPRKPVGPSGPPLRVLPGGSLLEAAPAPHPPRAATAAAGGHHAYAAGASRQPSDDLRMDQLNLNGAGHHHAHPAHAHAHASYQAHAGPPRPATAGAAAMHGPGVAGGGGGGAARPSLARAVAAVAAQVSDWQERVARLDGLSDALLAHADAGFGAAELSEVERLLPKLMAALDDGHFKISLAALTTVQATLRAAPRAVEPSLDKLMPLLFLKLCAPKESMRAAAEAALQTCALQFPADALTPALVRSLDAMKQPAARVSVMEFSVLFMGQGKVAGPPQGNMHLRQWVSRCLPLLLDKTPGVRRMAARALAVLQAGDPHFIASCLQHASGREAVAFERAVAAAQVDLPDSRPESPAGEYGEAHGVPAAGGYSGAAAAMHPGNGHGGSGSGGYAAGARANGGGHASGAAESHGVTATAALPSSGAAAAPLGHAAAATAAAAAAAAPAAAAPGGAAGDGDGGAGGVQHDILGRTFVAVAAPVPAALPRVDLPSDPAAQMRHLSTLVARLQTRPAEETLAELAVCAGGMSDDAWAASFSGVLLAALAATKHASDSVREAAFRLVRDLAAHHSDRFGPVLDVVVQPLLMGCADTSREVLMAAHQALEALIDAMPPQRTLDILRLKLPSADAVHSGTAVDGDVLCAAIRCVQRAATRVPPADLMAQAPGGLLPGLFAAFQHPRPDVRKVVVFCIVDLWMHVGDGLTPYLSSLSTSQLKLLTIYYTRAQEAHAAQQRRATADG